MRYSICRIDEGYTVEDMRSGDRMSYHKSYEAALKSLTKLRRSIVLRDEIVVEIWSTCREPVDDDPHAALGRVHGYDNVLAKGKGQGR
jgi:hypothetical protein